MTTKPRLCLVTDRRRLVEAVRRPLADAHALLLRQIEGAIAGGVDLVQIREGDLEASDLLRLVRDAVAVAAGSAARIVVNDRLDVALAARAAGVHLRESSLAAAQVRRLAPDLLVGRSIHDAVSAETAGPVDYLIAGNVFPTPSKPASTGLGLRGLADIVRTVPAIPVLAIGGVTPSAIGRLRATGATGVAAIGAFIPNVAADKVRSEVEKCAAQLRLAFDSDSAVFYNNYCWLL